MDLQKSTKGIMLSAINNFSKEFEVETTKTQLMIKASDENCTPKYQLLLNNKVVRDVTFNEILNLKIDFLGREIIATPFIASSLRKLRNEHECGWEEINVLIYKEKQEQDFPNMYFFKGSKPIKPITMDYIFGDIDK
ncbi:hypothetical protein [Winogradskyella sp.]|uniref:hypothetical protein n=1 Tax=Winogradskyella sp. TaxID=1883156 RepID=UPI003F69E28A